MQNTICETWESQYAWRLRGQTWMKHIYLLCCAWLWYQCADTQTFKACTFFVNHCVWQALHKAQNTNFLSQEGTCVQALKSYEGLANHETTSQTHTHTPTNAEGALFAVLNQHRRDFFYIQIDICDRCHVPMDPLLWHPENEGAWHFFWYAPSHEKWPACPLNQGASNSWDWLKLISAIPLPVSRARVGLVPTLPTISDKNLGQKHRGT